MPLERFWLMGGVSSRSREPWPRGIKKPGEHGVRMGRGEDESPGEAGAFWFWAGPRIRPSAVPGDKFGGADVRGNSPLRPWATPRERGLIPGEMLREEGEGARLESFGDAVRVVAFVRLVAVLDAVHRHQPLELDIVRQQEVL